MPGIRPLAALFIGQLLLSCSETIPKQPESQTIALSIDNTATAENIRRINSMQHLADQNGYAFEYAGSGDSLAGQVRGIMGLLGTQPDYLVVMPISYYGLEDAIEAAVEAGTRVILMDATARYPDDVAVRGVIKPDSVQEGALSSQAFADYFHGRPAAILEIQGRLGLSATRDRALGFRRGLSQHADLQIVDAYQDNITRLDAYNAMREAIERHGEEISGVFAHDDELGLGVQDALFDVGFRIPVVSVGGSADVAKSILSTDYLGTIAGGDGLNDLFRMLLSDSYQADEVVLDRVLYTDENARDLIR